MLIADIGLNSDQLDLVAALLGDRSTEIQGFLDQFEDVPAGAFGASTAGYTLGYHSSRAREVIRASLAEMADGLAQYKAALHGYDDAVSQADGDSKAAMQQIQVGLSNAEATVTRADSHGGPGTDPATSGAGS